MTQDVHARNPSKIRLGWSIAAFGAAVLAAMVIAVAAIPEPPEILGAASVLGFAALVVGPAVAVSGRERARVDPRKARGESMMCVGALLVFLAAIGPITGSGYGNGTLLLGVLGGGLVIGGLVVKP